MMMGENEGVVCGSSRDGDLLLFTPTQAKSRVSTPGSHAGGNFTPSREKRVFAFFSKQLPQVPSRILLTRHIRRVIYSNKKTSSIIFVDLNECKFSSELSPEG